MEKPRRVVLIGFGQIARCQHVPILCSRCARYELRVLVDPEHKATSVNINKARVPQLEEKTSSFDAVPVYSNLVDALDMTRDCSNGNKIKFQVAVIACPPEFAQDYATEALQAGLDVFMEKPPGFDSKRLTYLGDIAAKFNLSLFTAYHSTKSPEIRTARDWVSDDKKSIQQIAIEWKESAAKWHPGQKWISQNRFAVLDILINPVSMLEEILCIVFSSSDSNH